MRSKEKSPARRIAFASMFTISRVAELPPNAFISGHTLQPGHGDGRAMLLAEMTESLLKERKLHHNHGQNALVLLPVPMDFFHWGLAALGLITMM